MDEKLKILKRQVVKLSRESDILHNEELISAIYEFMKCKVQLTNIPQEEYDYHLQTEEELIQHLVTNYWMRLNKTTKVKCRLTKKAKERISHNQQKIISRIYSIATGMINGWRTNQSIQKSSPILEISDPTELYEFVLRNYIRESTSLEYRDAVRKLKDPSIVIDEVCQDYVSCGEGTPEYEDTILSIYWSFVHDDITLIGTADYSQVRYLVRSIDRKIKQYIKDIAYCKDPEYEVTYINSQISVNEGES